MMKCLLLATALSVAIASPAFAFHCPKDMAQIDAALAQGPKLTDAQMAEVKSLRAKGEVEHKAGNHQAAVDDLAKAKTILGLK